MLLCTPISTCHNGCDGTTPHLSECSIVFNQRAPEPNSFRKHTREHTQSSSGFTVLAFVVTVKREKKMREKKV